MKRRGRPILGTISGLVFGLFLAVDLVLFGVVELDSVAVTLVPIVGLVGGVALGITAPFGRRSSEPEGLGSDAPRDDEASEPASDT